MIIKKIEIDKNTKIYISKIFSNEEKDILEGLRLTNLDNDILSKAANKSYRLQFLSVRKLLSTVSNDSRIYYNNGIPFLVGESRNISISHTAKYVSIALSDANLGLDIESIDTDRIYKITDKFINEQEKEFIKDRHYVNIIWTSKEAIYKLMKIKGLSLKDNIIIKSFNKNKETCKAIVRFKDLELMLNVNYFFYDNNVISLVKTNKYSPK